MKVVVDWAGGMRFVGGTEAGQGLVMEGSALDGPRIGASPMEVVLIGMGGCASFDVVHILRKMRLDFEDVHCELEAERAPTQPRVFVKVHMVFTVTGNVPQNKADEAVRLSVEKYCSASAMIEKTAQITWEARVRPAGDAKAA
jgi:putative redox protein